MGCSSSVVNFVANDEVVGQDHWSLSVLVDDIELSKAEIDRIYAQFLDMDVDGSHEIKADEML